MTRAGGGVVVFRALPGAEIGLEEARENSQIIVALREGGRVRVLADIRRVKRMRREARVYVSQFAAENYAAVAILVGGPLSRLIGNFFVGLNAPRVPTRIFDDEDEACQWLADVA